MFAIQPPDDNIAVLDSYHENFIFTKLFDYLADISFCSAVII